MEGREARWGDVVLVLGRMEDIQTHIMGRNADPGDQHIYRPVTGYADLCFQHAPPVVRIDRVGPLPGENGPDNPAYGQEIARIEREIEAFVEKRSEEDRRGEE